VGKHLRYSEVKHADKFAEGLSAVWHRLERYILPALIVAGACLVLTVAWFVVARLFGGSGEAAWEERFELAQEAAARAKDEPEGGSDKLLDRMSAFVQKHQGAPAAAVTLLELAQGHNRRAAALRDESPKAAREHLQKAANAAEQFIADFPDQRPAALAIAHYEAAKARMELGEWERAADHYEKATAAGLPALAAMARWQAGYCYEQLGRLDQARLKYEELRADPAAGWCGEQADFALAQLGRRPAKPR